MDRSDDPDHDARDSHAAGGVPASGPAAPRPSDASERTARAPNDGPAGGDALAAVDALLASEPMLPVPLDLVSRVLAEVEREPAFAPTPAPRLPRFAWRVAAAAIAVALGAHLAFEPNALASVESIASLRLPFGAPASTTDPVTAPIASVLDAGRESVRRVTGTLPSLGSLDVVAEAGESDSVTTTTLFAGGSVLLAAGLAAALVARRGRSTALDAARERSAR